MLTGLNVDEYFTRTDSSGTMAFLADAIRSTIGVVNPGGSIDTNYTYEPFGNTTVSGSNANPYQFTGRENDGTRLYYYRARYYSPTLQRFVSQDPIGFAGDDANLYGYVSNDPTNLIDPPGLWGVGVTGSASGEGGLGTVSVAGTGSTSVGYFSQGGLQRFNSAGGYGFGPNGQSLSPPCPGGSGNTFGEYSGGGLNIFGTNANNASELTGPFRTYSFNLGAGLRVISGQVSIGYDSAGDLRVEVNLGLPFLPGLGFGADASAYNTNSWLPGSGGGSGGGGCSCH